MSSVPKGVPTTLGNISSGRSLRSPVGKHQSEFAGMVKEVRELLVLESELVKGTFERKEVQHINNCDTPINQRVVRLPPRVTSARVPLHTVSDFSTNIERRTKCNPQEGLLGVSIFDESGLQVTSSGELDDGTGTAVGVLSRIYAICNSIENPSTFSSTSRATAATRFLSRGIPSRPTTSRGGGESDEEEWGSKVILQAEQALQTPFPLGPFLYPQELSSVMIEISTGDQPSSSPSSAAPGVPDFTSGGGRVICLAPCTDDLPPSHRDIDAAKQQLQQQSIISDSNKANTHASYLALHSHHASKRAAIELTLNRCRLQQQELLSSLAFVCSPIEKALVAVDILNHRRDLVTQMMGSERERRSQQQSASYNEDSTCSSSLIMATVHKGTV